MNAHRGLSVFLVLALLFSLVTSSIAQPTTPEVNSSTVASYPWKVEVFESVTNSTRFSAVFVGLNQLPMLAYIDNGIYTDATPDSTQPNHCGPGDLWNCYQNPFVGRPLSGNVISDVATYSNPDAGNSPLGIAFFSTNGNVYVYDHYFSSAGVTAGFAYFQLMDLPDNQTVKGQPAIAFDLDNYPRMAIFIDRTDVDMEYLKYVYHTDSENTSCGFTSFFQCDTILTTFTLDELIGSPQIELIASGEPRITYLINDEFNKINLFYAYPQSNLEYFPNCGPGINTWRCVEVSSELADGVSAGFDFAMGPNRPHVAYTRTDGLSQTWLYHAERVGSLGGNCGEDWVRNLLGNIVLINTWKCSSQLSLMSTATPQLDISIQVDLENMPVIAYTAKNGSYHDLHVIRKVATDDWDDVLIAAGSVHNTIGPEIGLTINDSGMGFLIFRDTNVGGEVVKIAYQQAKLYLPVIRR